MLLTEKEAKGKWCPHARTLNVESMEGTDGVYYNMGPAWAVSHNRYGNNIKDRVGGTTLRHEIVPGAKCIASKCMAWEWSRLNAEEDDQAQWEGYCGLTHSALPR